MLSSHWHTQEACSCYSIWQLLNWQYISQSTQYNCSSKVKLLNRWKSLDPLTRQRSGFYFMPIVILFEANRCEKHSTKEQTSNKEIRMKNINNWSFLFPTFICEKRLPLLWFFYWNTYILDFFPWVSGRENRKKSKMLETKVIKEVVRNQVQHLLCSEEVKLIDKSCFIIL